MGKPNTVAAGVDATAAPADQVVRLFIKQEWQAGAITYAPNWESSEPHLIDLANPDSTIQAGNIDYLIASGAAESQAMREARVRAEKKADQ
jgi:hypothetical protein